MTIRQPADGRRLDFVALGPRIGDNVNMVWQETPFTVPLIIGAHIAMIASFFVPRGRSVPGTLSARVMLIASALWTGSYAAEMACATLDGKILCNKIEYCGIVVVPFTLLGFAFAYSGRMDLVTKRRAILASVIPAITLVLVFTNDAHHLIWTNNILVSNGSYVIMRNTYGACFYLYVVYIYISMALAAGLVLQLLFRSPHMYATQATALLLTVGVPWVANILYVTKATPFPDFDLTPLSFSIASVAMVWGISGLRVGDMVSVSRGVALDGISDALFVLDNDDRVAHCNLAARTLTEKPSYHIVGQPIEKLLPEWPFSRISDLNPYQSSKTTASRRPVTVRSRDSALDLGCAEMVLKTAIGKNTYEVRLSAINDWRGREISKVAIIRDISDRKHLEEELDRRYVEARRLAENDPVTGLYNHRVFHQKLELEIRRTQRTSRPISVIIMDIDGFKLFNDTYGHPVGDNILRSIAILLVKTAREIDILAR